MFTDVCVCVCLYGKTVFTECVCACVSKARQCSLSVCVCVCLYGKTVFTECVCVRVSLRPDSVH